MNFSSEDISEHIMQRKVCMNYVPVNSFKIIKTITPGIPRIKENKILYRLTGRTIPTVPPKRYRSVIPKAPLNIPKKAFFKGLSDFL